MDWNAELLAWTTRIQSRTTALPFLELFNVFFNARNEIKEMCEHYSEYYWYFCYYDGRGNKSSMSPSLLTQCLNIFIQDEQNLWLWFTGHTVHLLQMWLFLVQTLITSTGNKSAVCDAVNCDISSHKASEMQVQENIYGKINAALTSQISHWLNFWGLPLWMERKNGLDRNKYDMTVVNQTVLTSKDKMALPVINCT